MSGGANERLWNGDDIYITQAPLTTPATLEEDCISAGLGENRKSYKMHVLKLM
jgi:hypothetical protein